MAITFAHCLRPVFTERIVQLLETGRSINLIGADGTGRRRLLEDIQQCHLPDLTIILADLKSYRKNYAGFITAIWKQTGQNRDTPTNLSDLIERCAHQGGKFWLLLHNFDALLDNPDVDPHYDIIFYDALNACRNKPNMVLVCVTQKRHDQSVVFVGGKAHRNSWLDLEPIEAPLLTHAEIDAELKRQPLPKNLTHNEGMQLIEAISNHPTKQYNFLRYVVEKVICQEHHKQPFPKRLTLWEKAFEARPFLPTPAQVNRFQDKVGFWRKLLGLESERLTARWKLLIKILVGLLGLAAAIGIGKPELLKALIELLKGWLS